MSRSVLPAVALVVVAAAAGCRSSAGAASDGAAPQGGGGEDGAAGSAGDGRGLGTAGAADGGVGGPGCVSRTPGQWQLTSSAGEPPPLTSPGVALWSGSALFVIGYSTKGGKYDPCLDTWQPFPAHAGFTSLVLATTDGAYFNEPTLPDGTPQIFSFFDFTAVAWRQLSTAGYPTAADRGGTTLMVGSRLVRWGGIPQSTSPYPLLTNTGATYDRAADRWQPMSTAGAPSERVIGTNVVDAGGRLFIWGGARTPPAATTVMQGDPTAAALTQTPGLVCPDWNPENCSYGNGALYDPASDSWTAVSDTGAPAARHDQLTAWTGTRVLVWGGAHYVTISNGEISNAYLTDGALYDPAAKSWTPTAPAPALKMYAVPGATFSGGLMYMRDGADSQSPVYTYDPATDRWATAQPGPTMPARTGGPHNATIFWTGSYWIAFGGYRDGQTPPTTCPSPPLPMTGCDSPGPMQIPVSEAAVALPAP
jgi:hypothetical protein